MQFNVMKQLGAVEISPLIKDHELEATNMIAATSSVRVEKQNEMNIAENIFEEDKEQEDEKSLSSQDLKLE